MILSLENYEDIVKFNFLIGKFFGSSDLSQWRCSILLVRQNNLWIDTWKRKFVDAKPTKTYLYSCQHSSEIKETEKNLLELEKSLYNLKKYYDYHDTEYQLIRDIITLFGEVDEGYYKPIKTKSAFNGNYIEYESKGDKDKNLLPIEYLDMIRPYLRDMINDHKTRREWKIQLTMQINFISSKDSEETRTMYTKSHNIEIMMGNKTDEIIKTLFKSLLQNYHKDLEESMRRNKFVPNSIDLLYYHLQKIGLKRGGSYIDSPEWLKNKKATINLQNNDDNCFQYAVTATLNNQNIENNPQRISKIKLLLISIIGKK